MKPLPHLDGDGVVSASKLVIPYRRGDSER